MSLARMICHAGTKSSEHSLYPFLHYVHMTNFPSLIRYLKKYHHIITATGLYTETLTQPLIASRGTRFYREVLLGS